MLSKEKVKGHMALMGANTMWGIMSPVSKILLATGCITATALTDVRLIFGTVFFGVTSLFVKKESIDRKDYIKLFAAAFFSVTLNQILFVNGVSLTSPIDASISTSSLPIWTILLSAIFLRERITGSKILGVLFGIAGSFILILNGPIQLELGDTNIYGSLMCLGSQISYAIYLVFFQDIIKKYSPITLMKWKYLFGAIMLLPFSITTFPKTDWTEFTSDNWLSLVYILLFGTYFSYMIIPLGQKVHKPTVVAMYNYLQPVCATIFAVFFVQDNLTPMKIIATTLIFTGVMLVNRNYR